jgi:hypothetical protein
MKVFKRRSNNTIFFLMLWVFSISAGAGVGLDTSAGNTAENIESGKDVVAQDLARADRAAASIAKFRHPAAAVVVPILMKAVAEFILYQLEDGDKARADKIRAEIERQTLLYEQRQQAAEAKKESGQTRGFLVGSSEKMYSAAEVLPILGDFLEYLLLAAAVSKEDIVNNFFSDYQLKETGFFCDEQCDGVLAEE